MGFGICKKTINNIFGFYRMLVGESTGVFTHSVKIFKRRNRFVGEVNSCIELREFHIQKAWFVGIAAISNYFGISGIAETEWAF